MPNILQMAWRQVYASTMLPSEQDATEQRRLSWARTIESYSAVPGAYKDFFEAFREKECIFPYTILTPTFEGFLSSTTENLICEGGHEIAILKRNGNTFEAQCYPLEGISCVETRTILLETYIKISGVTRQGVPASVTFKFNSATDHLFTPILERIRLAFADSKHAAQSSELETFDQWARLSHKFMNYGKRSLLGGEKVVHAILQPEIRVGAFTILGKTHYRRISSTHAAILTGRELIIIREDERHRAGRYSSIWDYIPLNKIASLSLRAKNDDLLAVTVNLPESEGIELLFQASAEREVNQLLQRYKELTAA